MTQAQTLKVIKDTCFAKRIFDGNRKFEVWKKSIYLFADNIEMIVVDNDRSIKVDVCTQQ